MLLSAPGGCGPHLWRQEAEQQVQVEDAQGVGDDVEALQVPHPQREQGCQRQPDQPPRRHERRAFVEQYLQPLVELGCDSAGAARRRRLVDVALHRAPLRRAPIDQGPESDCCTDDYRTGLGGCL